MVINKSLSDDYLLYVTAHELAHVSQKSYDFYETNRLEESTATWVGYRVLRRLDKVSRDPYSDLNDFFGGLFLTLTRETDHNSYNSWLFFYFASMEKGDGIVSSVWNAASQPGQQGITAVDDVFDLDEYFDDFAVRNWNRDPVIKQYKDDDKEFPGGKKPVTSVIDPALPREYQLDEAVLPLSAQYYSFRFDDSVRKVTFENLLYGIPYAHVWAIPQIDYSWQAPQDWTSEHKKEFCRDAAGEVENITRLILIVSNTHPTDSLLTNVQPKVKDESVGCTGWRGTMTGTWTMDVEGYTLTSTATFAGTWRRDLAEARNFHPCRSPSNPANACTAYLAEGTVAWTWDAHAPGNPPCNDTKSGEVPAGVFVLPDDQTFVLEPDGPDKYIYWSAGLWFPEVDGLKCNDPINGGNHPPSFAYIPYTGPIGHDLSLPAGPGSGLCSQGTWRIDINAKTISGSCLRDNLSYNHVRWDWNLYRLDPPPP